MSIFQIKKGIIKKVKWQIPEVKYIEGSITKEDNGILFSLLIKLNNKEEVTIDPWLSGELIEDLGEKRSGEFLGELIAIEINDHLKLEEEVIGR